MNATNTANNIIAQIDQLIAENNYLPLALKLWTKGNLTRLYSSNSKHGYVGINADGSIINPLGTCKSNLYSMIVELQGAGRI